MITVYHLLNDASNRDIRDDMYYERDSAVQEEMCKSLWMCGLYAEVAKVDTDRLSLAFALTNHVDSTWTEDNHPAVTVLQDDARSTSVCDLLVKDGRFYFVARGCAYNEMKLPARG